MLALLSKWTCPLADLAMDKELAVEAKDHGNLHHRKIPLMSGRTEKVRRGIQVVDG